MTHVHGRDDEGKGEMDGFKLLIEKKKFILGLAGQYEDLISTNLLPFSNEDTRSNLPDSNGRPRRGNLPPAESFHHPKVHNI